jgi:ABC-type transport system substrate-binding protein/class 3 adenylate cyclase
MSSDGFPAAALLGYNQFDMSPTENDPIAALTEAIAQLEAQREVLEDTVLEAALASMREKLASLLGRNQPIERQRKLATLLFADIVDSTRIGLHMDPEEILEIMDQALKRLAGPIEENGGHVTRFMGDGFKAVFGFPIAHEDDAERAIRAGLQIHAIAREYGRQIEEKWGIGGFQVRVGINTGLVVIGGVTEAEDTVMGSPVNLAARLESAAPPGGVLVSHNTYRHVRGIFEVESMEPIQMKGFDDPIPTYLVKRAKPRALRVNTRGVEGIETRMVGRETELRYLQDAFHTILEDGEGQVLTVIGEAGIGKSRLLYEFQNWLELQAQTTYVFVGRARQEAQSLPYALLRDAFASYFNVRDDEPAGQAREKVETGFCEVFGSDEAGKLRAQFIGQLLGFDFGDSPVLRSALSNPQQLRNRALAFLGEYYSALTSREPVILFLEDVHWADDSSLDALNYLGRRTPGQCFLILCLARPALFERRRFWGEGQTYHHRLDLSPLSTAESRKLVGEILQKVVQVPAALNELVIGEAEGNPFFIEELIKVLIEEGVIRKGDEHWQVSSEMLPEVKVPASLTGVLQARLDALSEIEKTVLQMASIVGRIFWDQAVAHLYAATHDDYREEAILNILRSLRDKELIFRREESTYAGAREYLFKHEVLREVTYETVLRKMRQVYHGRVADWLIENSAKRAGEVTGLIADHLERAGRRKEAVDYLLQAGDKARTLYAHQEAADHYQRSVQILRSMGKDESAAQVLMKLGLAFHTAFDFERARRAYAEGFALWQRAKEELPDVDLLPAPHPLRMVWSDPPSLDPTMGGTNWMAAICFELFSGLVGQSPEMEVIPDVAHSWEMLEDGKKYIFHLRKDVYWSDGVPVTAADFEFTFKRALKPETKAPVAGLLLHGIKGARARHLGQTSDASQVGVYAVDDETLVIELEEPTGYFMQDLSYYVLLPVPRHAVETHGAAWSEPEHIVTNGPFRLKAWQREDHLLLEKNPQYHGRFTGNAEQIHLKLGVDSQAQRQLYTAAQLDLVYNWFTDTSVIDDLRHEHPEEYQHRPRFVTIYLIFDITKPPFNDRRVRQAFVAAIDRETLADVIYRGYDLAGTGGFVPPGMPGYSPDIGLVFDPVRARRLLAEAGYADNLPPREITCLTVPARELLANYLQSQWQDNLR